MNTKNKIIGSVIIALLITLGIYGLWYKNYPTTTVTNPIENVRVVTVDRPVLTTKVIDKLVTDPKQQALINAQVKQLNDLKYQVTNLTNTIATLHESGGVGTNNGTISETSTSKPNPVVEETKAIGEISITTERSYEFKDFQLNVKYDATGSTFVYDLNQSFVVTTITGKSKDGTKLTTVSLNQSTPTGLRQIPATTIEVNTNESAPRWSVGLRVNGGLGVYSANHYGGVIGLQWLTFGSSTAAEDTRFALFTPAVGFTKNNGTVGIIPININLGRIKHNPLKNTWIGPSVDIDKRVGLAISASF